MISIVVKGTYDIIAGLDFCRESPHFFADGWGYTLSTCSSARWCQNGGRDDRDSIYMGSQVAEDAKLNFAGYLSSVLEKADLRYWT